MKRVTFTDYQEPLSVKVAQAVLSRGFQPASNGGIAIDMDRVPLLIFDDDHMGVILSGSTRNIPMKKSFFGLVANRRPYLGTIWFQISPLSQDSVDASKNRWTFTLIGREYRKVAIGLAESLAQEFDVEIVVTLVEEEPRLETFVQDLYA